MDNDGMLGGFAFVLFVLGFGNVVDHPTQIGGWVTMVVGIAGFALFVVIYRSKGQDQNNR